MEEKLCLYTFILFFVLPKKSFSDT